MRATKLSLRGVATVAALTLVLAACSSSDGGSSTTTTGSTGSTGATTATEAPTSTAAEGTAVAVAVGETDVQHMYMNLDQTTVPAGTVTFTVANEGVKKHEFVILSTDVMAADMKVEASDEVNEDAFDAVDEIGDLPAGDTATLTVDLAPGHYALICNLKGHVRMGMYSDITVT
jgi:uncharacterized cupredoxin-like copper-binding protein